MTSSCFLHLCVSPCMEEWRLSLCLLILTQQQMCAQLLCSHSARFAYACRFTCVYMCTCVSVFLYLAYVPVIVFPVCVLVLGMRAWKSQLACADVCVQLLWQSGQLPPISHHKENIDIKWSNCATQQERRGMAISRPWRTTWVNCLAFCVSVVMEDQGKESRTAHKSALGEKTASY